MKLVTVAVMIKALVLLVGISLAGAAQAQIKCWTDAKGRRACGDTPPPGVKVETLKGAPEAVETKKAIPAPAPQAPEYRGRRAEPQKAASKREPPKPQIIGNMQECERAREMLRAMGGGGRSKRTDAVRARALEADNCTS